MIIIITHIIISIIYIYNAIIPNNKIIATYNVSFIKSKDNSYKTIAKANLYISELESIYIGEELENILDFQKGIDLSYKTNSARKKASDGISNIDYIILKNKENSQLSYISEIDKKQYAGYSQNFVPQNQWQISQDTATITGLLCNKAILKYSGRKWTAWYTQEVPINDGPDIFNGLPGLIIKLDSEDGEYSFQLSGLQKANNILVEIPPYNTVSKVKFKELKLAKYENIFSSAKEVELKMDGKTLNKNEVKSLILDSYLNKNHIEKN